MNRRGFLAALAGVAGTPWLASCTSVPSVRAEEVLRLYEAGDLEAVSSLFPQGQLVELTGVVFDDWAYPDPEQIAAVQPDPAVFREVTAKDSEGGSTYHGIKLRLGPVDENVLHRSGPKVIAFLPYAATSDVRLLKEAYAGRFPLRCTVRWLGVLKGAVWAFPAVEEDDMVAFTLHGVRRA